MDGKPAEESPVQTAQTEAPITPVTGNIKGTSWTELNAAIAKLNDSRLSEKDMEQSEEVRKIRLILNEAGLGSAVDVHEYTGDRDMQPHSYFDLSPKLPNTTLEITEPEGDQDVELRVRERQPDDLNRRVVHKDLPSAVSNRPV